MSNFKQHVKYFLGNGGSTDHSLALEIESYAKTHNLYIQNIAYSTGHYGHALVLFTEMT